jgi:hypothetical protein
MKEMTDQELRLLAADIYEGRVFTDRQVEDSSDLPMVFMPIALGAFAEMTEEEFKQIGLIYEYLDKAGPRAINGLPSFFSLRVLDIQYMPKLQQYLDAYKAIKEGFFGSPTENPQDVPGDVQEVNTDIDDRGEI